MCKVASSVAIPVDGKVEHFSAILLRDLCQCPLCVHVSTKQKLFSTTDIPPSIQARKVNLPKSNENSLSILWDHDVPGFDGEHLTKLNINHLREAIESGAPLGPPSNFTRSQILWDAKTCNVTDFEYEDYMHDDATLFRALQQFHDYGLVFLKNVPGVEESVSMVAERIGPVKDTLYGQTWDGRDFEFLFNITEDISLIFETVRSVPAPINAAYTSSDLGFHSDLLYTDNPAHIQFLHCIQSSSVGGASVFVDAYRTATDLFRLYPDAFNVLADLSVNYHYNHPGSNVYCATKPVIDLRSLQAGDVFYNSVSEFITAWEKSRRGLEKPTSTLFGPLDVADCLVKVNWGPPFMAPFSLSEQKMEQAKGNGTVRENLNTKINEWHAAARKFSALLHRPEMLHERLMQPGECVLFDNTRVLHSRKAFDAVDAGKSRWLRGTYVDKDPYLSKIRVLMQQFG